MVHLTFSVLFTARQMVYPPPEGTVSTHVPATTAASPQSLPPNTPVNCPQTSAGAISRSERQQEILIVVLPAALATVVIVLVIAIVSILVCVCITRRSTKE